MSAATVQLEDVAAQGIDAPWDGLPASLLGLTEWPEEPDSETWRRLLGRPPRGVVVLTDEQVGASHGQLRALPLLRALGVTRFTFANGWRGLDLVPFSWQRVAEDTPDHALEGLFPICQFVSQEMEDTSPGDAVYRLLRARERAGPDALLVYVFDTPRFARRRDPQVRPFADEHELMQPVEYARLAQAYAGWRAPAGGQPLLSLNLAWHGLTAYRAAPPPQRLEELFNLNRYRPDSPIWELYAHLCDLAGAVADGMLVRAAIRAWVDRELTASGDQLVLWLQRMDFDPAQVALRRQMQGRREHQGR